MTTQLTILAWTLVLAIVQIFLPAGFRNRETGIAFNAGPRDEPGPPVGKVTGRLQRAQKNLYESLPLKLAHRDGALTLWGAWTYFLMRIIYVPLYAFGVPMVRSVAWMLSLLGLVLILIAILKP